jgi:hypothetical protein
MTSSFLAALAPGSIREDADAGTALAALGFIAAVGIVAQGDAAARHIQATPGRACACVAGTAAYAPRGALAALGHIALERRDSAILCTSS